MPYRLIVAVPDGGRDGGAALEVAVAVIDVEGGVGGMGTVRLPCCMPRAGSSTLMRWAGFPFKSAYPASLRVS